MIKNITFLALLSSYCALAANTVPLLGWTTSSNPQKNLSLALLAASTRESSTSFSSVSDNLAKIIPCGQVTVIAEIPELHASDLLKYSQSFEYVKAAASPENTFVSIAHLDSSDTNPSSVSSSQLLIKSIEKSCKSVILEKINSLDDLISVINSSTQDEEGDPLTRILLITLEPFKHHNNLERVVLKKNDDFLRQVSNSLPLQHTFMLTGGPSPRKLEKRAAPITAAPKFIPFEKRTIFQKYVFFNTGILASLFIILILITILLAAVMSVASLQTPTRFESKRKNA